MKQNFRVDVEHAVTEAFRRANQYRSEMKYAEANNEMDKSATKDWFLTRSTVKNFFICVTRTDPSCFAIDIVSFKLVTLLFSDAFSHYGDYFLLCFVLYHFVLYSLGLFSLEKKVDTGLYFVRLLVLIFNSFWSLTCYFKNLRFVISLKGYKKI